MLLLLRLTDKIWACKRHFFFCLLTNRFERSSEIGLRACDVRFCLRPSPRLRTRAYSPLTLTPPPRDHNRDQLARRAYHRTPRPHTNPRPGFFHCTNAISESASALRESTCRMGSVGGRAADKSRAMCPGKGHRHKSYKTHTHTHTHTITLD